MKSKKNICMLLLLAISMKNFGQTAQTPADTTVRLHVYGVCEQCKERIEKAAKIKAVHIAEWNMETGILTLEYDRAHVSLDKIKNRIIAVGHDLDDRKSINAVYNALPKCCLYRNKENLVKKINHGNEIVNAAQNVTDTFSNDRSMKQEVLFAAPVIKGIVLEEDKQGNFKPLMNASIVWMNTKIGTLTDSAGFFNLPSDNHHQLLVVSFAGYKSDTINAINTTTLKVVLASGKQLKEITVTSKQRSSYINNASPIRIQMMTGKELLKAACCNLSESFETNPSVDVSYNDAVTGSKQIQLLGLSGNYTQLTIENLPGPRGIATPLGLNSIAGPWIESIQLTKGVGSVANGYESIAGQINVELKKPGDSEKLLANLYVNDFGKADLNLNLSQQLNKKWWTGLLLHDDFFDNKKLDFNKDGFRDQPTGNTFSLINRYKFDNGNGTIIQFGIKMLKDHRIGGETGFDPDADKNTTNKYGIGIHTERYEVFAKAGYIFPKKKYKSIGLQTTVISHQQDAYFGLTNYRGNQQTFYSNLIYQSIIGTTAHKFRTGISFAYDKFDETFKIIRYRRNETVPGIFGEYTFTPNEKFSAIAGLRADQNNLFGFFLTPRLNIRYEPVKGTVIRLSVGRGQRTANIFAENMGSFISSRQLNLVTTGTGKAYGLNPEVAWNKGISLDQQFNLFRHEARFSADFFRNDFKNQVVVDAENPDLISFYNLQGRSYSNSFQTELDVEPADRFEIKIAYRYFDVKTSYNGQLLQRPLIAANRAFVNLAYGWKGFKFDYTVTYNGRKRLPDTKTNLLQYQLPAYSPGFMMMNAQVSKTAGNKSQYDFYIGAENLSNYFQKQAIVAPGQPFGNYFDASMVWGPINGRMFYAGIRYKIK